MRVEAPFSHPNGTKLFGPAGAGKTRQLVTWLREHEDGGDFRVRDGIICSFTRAAAHDIARRVRGDDGEPAPYHATLHALARRYHGIDQQLAEPRLGEFFAEHHIAYDRGTGADTDQWIEAGGSPGNLINAFWVRCRNLLISLDEGLRRETPAPKLVPYWDAGTMNRLFGRYLEWKRQNSLVDFTDMLEDAAASPPSGTQWPVFVVDEAQDQTPLQWRVAQGFAAASEVCYVAGDDDQCQPPGTMVWTTTGPVPIEQLDRATHRLLAYDRAGAAVVGTRNGYAFRSAARPYTGLLHSITAAGGRTSRCTPDHRWLARWTDVAKGAHVVYLMRRGDWWRMGWCKLRRVDGAYHLGHRARLEGADAAWILHVAQDRTDASVTESFLSAQYGIPTATFNPVAGAEHLTREAIDTLFGRFEPGRLTQRALRLLCDRQLDPAHPAWCPGGVKRGGCSVMEVHAANILPGLMEIPVPGDGTTARWTTVTANHTHPYDGVVYSLDVETHHTYIADGLVTHNCLYSWSGAQPESFLDADLGGADILHVNHRSGSNIVDYAQAFIRRNRVRVDKGMVAANEGGVVEHCDELPVLHPAQSTFLMARAHYLMSDWITDLEERGYPFLDRRKSGGVNGRAALAYRRFLALRDGRRLTLAEWRLLATDAIASDGPWLTRGAKTRLRALDAQLAERTLVGVDDLTAYGGTADLQDAIRAGAVAPLSRLPQKRIGYLRRVAERWGEEYLDEHRAASVCQVGPIHQFKGLECDHAVVHSGLPPAAVNDALVNPEAERRVIYVAMTRARERLSIVNAHAAVQWQTVL